MPCLPNRSQVHARPGAGLAGHARRPEEACAAAPVAQPGDVRGVRRQHPDHRAVRSRRSAARARRRRASSWRSRSGCGSRCCSPTSPRPWPRAAARRRPKACARPSATSSPRSWRRPEQRQRHALTLVAADGPAQGRRRPRRGRRLHPRRRRSHRGRRLGRRERHHRRIGAGHPRIGRRLLLGHRRHAGAVRLAGGARHRQPGRSVPRPHDRDGRRRQAPEDAERDRAHHPAGRRMTIVFLLATVTLLPFSIYSVELAKAGSRSRSPCWSRCWSA